MSRPAVDGIRAARVAVIGAESPCGAFLREALAEQGVPGSRVDLFGATHGEAVLSEYDGEARLIQEPDPEQLGGHDFVFLCDASEASRRVAADPAGKRLVIDLAAARGNGHPAPVVHPDINPQAIEGHGGIVAVPHPLSAVIADVLHALERTVGVARATIVAVRPASDYGERGLEELRDQTVGLLRFSEPPKDVFGRQLAFNLIPAGLFPQGHEPDLESRIVAEVGALLGWREPRIAVALMMAPVFYGHSLVLRFEPARAAAFGDVVTAFRSLEGDASTPIDAAGSRAIVASQVRRDGLGGFWAWIVAGEAGPAAAALAVRLAGLADEN
jgi:aspartate-semialdehyde dehydrogenase